MMTYDDAAIAAHPQAPAAELARIVNQRPDLRVVVAANPGAQPALLDWLASLHDPAVDAALAARAARAVQHFAPAPTPAVGDWAPQPVEPAAPGWAPQAQPLPAAQPWGTGTATVVQDVAFQPYETEARGSRKKLWIGLAVTAVVLVAGGALAAYLMVFSKLGGASTPEAAVTQLIEGAAHKDGVAMYGVLAPSEVSSLGDMVSPLSQASEGSTDPKQLMDLLDAFDIDLSGLTTSSETIGTDLAKVSITGGTLTVDGDAKKITAALAKAYAPMMGTQGLSEDDTDQMWDEAATALDEQLPWTVKAADLTWDSESGTNKPFLVSVKEGGSWYVSPLMSVGEYVFVSGSADLVRGTMPTGDGKAAASAAEAGTAFAKALGDLFTGDAGPLADVLPTAEARFTSVYGQAWLDAAGAESFEGAPTVDEATFSSTSIGGDLARLAATKVVLGGDEPVTIEGTCATEGTAGEKVCLADTEMAEQLGLDEVGLVAVQGDGGWRVSLLATLGDASRIVADHMAELKKSGELDEGSLLSQLLMGSTSLGVGSPLEDSGFGEASGGLGSDDEAGAFTFDEDGNLLDPDGNIVEGSSLDPDDGAGD